MRAGRSCRNADARRVSMSGQSRSANFFSLPKAELHLHLEGSIEPATVCALAARHGALISEAEARRRYAYHDFGEFIESFKWVTSFLRTPADYAVITRELAERLIAQNVVYAEVTLSIGVMLLREQDVDGNFKAIRRAAEDCEKRGLRLKWIFDAVRQFGAEAAMVVARLALEHKSAGVVAFGIGGDELAIPASEFRAVYDHVAEEGLHRVIHAGETGGPEQIRDAVEVLGAERIGHGIGAMHDLGLMDVLAERRISLEICPTSNVRTGALARQLNRRDARILEHPLPKLFRHGIPVVLSTDDPAMFHTTLLQEYGHAQAMGLREAELESIVEAGFAHAFLQDEERRGLRSSRPARRFGPML